MTLIENKNLLNDSESDATQNVESAQDTHPPLEGSTTQKPNIFKKGWGMFTHGLDRKAIGIICILAVADLFVFSGVLYLRYIIPNFHTFLGIDQDQFDLATACYGFVSLAVRIPGGWIADRFSAKRLLTLALVLTGLIAVWWTIVARANFQDSARMAQLYAIYSLWGVTISGMFWAPLWKLVSQNVPKEKQGVAYGLQGTLVGLFGVIIISVGATLVTDQTKVLQAANAGRDKESLPFLIFAIIICVMVFVMALLAWIFIPNRQREVEQVNFKQKFFALVKPAKFLRVWLTGIFVFGMYMFQSTFAYYMKDTLTQVGVGASVVTIIAAIRSYGLRFLIANPIGRLSDKWKSYVKGLIIILSIGLTFCMLFTFMPGWGTTWFEEQSSAIRTLMLVVMCVLYTIIGCIGWALLTLRFVQIGELPMEKNNYAGTLSFISWLAFTPDAWFNFLAKYIGGLEGNYNLNAETGKKSYNLQGLQILLCIALGCVALGLICGSIVYILNKREIKKLGKDSFRWRELGNV